MDKHAEKDSYSFGCYDKALKIKMANCCVKVLRKIENKEL